MSKIPSMSMDSARGKGFSLKLWFRFAAFWIVVLGIGVAVSFYVLPYGLLWLVAVADEIRTANYGQ
jgi:hypothetical protein